MQERLLAIPAGRRGPSSQEGMANDLGYSLRDVAGLDRWEVQRY